MKNLKAIKAKNAARVFRAQAEERLRRQAAAAEASSSSSSAGSCNNPVLLGAKVPEDSASLQHRDMAAKHEDDAMSSLSSNSWLEDPAVQDAGPPPDGGLFWSVVKQALKELCCCS
ncbi:unnamed protein product [Symbiodinium pilosum]|uniref:Uncharacterized protein n=1 Tax=Symbiodinium pilosum TaxID=2952 RepID=A0A812MIE3_SYMPI|nr:unnamed protein product [Symbiodinium pilosum]